MYRKGKDIRKETSSCICLCSCWILNDMGRNFLLGNGKKIAKCLMRTFTCRSTFLYAMQVVCKNMSSGEQRRQRRVRLEIRDERLASRLNELFCRRVTFLAKHAQLAEMKLSCRLGWHSETGVYIGMYRDFVCLWHRHNCNWSLPFCADLLILLNQLLGF